MSVACAEDKLMPALRDVDPDALVLADGFSCRTQIRDLSDRRPMHIAQVIAAGLSTHESGTRAAQIVNEQFVRLIVAITAVAQHGRRVHGRNKAWLGIELQIGP